MKKSYFPLTLLFIALLTTLAGCDTGPESPRGFSLPKGDSTRGEQVFLQSQCLSCHTLKGYDRSAIEKDPNISVSLGGSVTRIKTYAELVTSVINPTHRLAKGYSLEVIQQDGESKMRNYNDIMTVSQLVDLVAFLQPHYKLVNYQPTHYPNI